MKKAKESITCDLRYYQGDIPPDMLEVLKRVWSEAYKEYQDGNDISLCFKLVYGYQQDGAWARLAPFFHLAKGYSLSASTSDGQEPPITTLFKAIHIHIGKPKTQVYKCLRCNHEWPSKLAHPRVCPKCKTPYWDKERRK